ncbi:MAG: hypothetical protein RAO94_13410 [Candidatus Stygibacter australis]|nr:hypothetical protein [Candidatus Stygibacter australis]MDP8323338.1 hypothetical protein [Candidatus Stygibacter australis]
MKIRFRDVSSGIVEARAVLEIKEGILLNEITILSRNGQIEVELPQKSFKGKDGKMHFMDVVTFDNEDRKTLWMMEIKEEYNTWRQTNKKVLVYET